MKKNLVSKLGAQIILFSALGHFANATNTNTFNYVDQSTNQILVTSNVNNFLVGSSLTLVPQSTRNGYSFKLSSLSHALPSGLTLSTSNGQIKGTTSQVSNATTYIVCLYENSKPNTCDYTATFQMAFNMPTLVVGETTNVNPTWTAASKDDLATLYTSANQQNIVNSLCKQINIPTTGGVCINLTNGNIHCAQNDKSIHDSPETYCTKKLWNIHSNSYSANPTTMSGKKYNKISSAAQWLDFGANCSSTNQSACGSNILILNDLDFGAAQSVPSGANLANGVLNVTRFDGVLPGSCMGEYAFTGIIDGGDSTFYNLKITSSASSQDYCIGGVVGQAYGATIKNINISSSVSFSIALSESAVGGIVGASYGGTISKVSNASSITSNNAQYAWIGGISGMAVENTSISFASNSGTISDPIDIGTSIGGISGFTNNESTITNSYNTGNISGNSLNFGIGGIVGQAVNTQVSTSFNTGSISSVGSVNCTPDLHCGVGGIVGGTGTINITSITNSYNTGTITTVGNDVGGIIGLSTTSSETAGHSITNCYTTTGKLFGGAAAIITNSYSLSTATPAPQNSLSPNNFGKEASFNDWDFTSTWVIGSGLTTAPSKRPVLSGLPPK